MTIIDAVADGASAVVVSWSDADDDEVQTASITLEWQPEERDVGISAGWITDGDAPEAVLSYAAEWASDRRRDDERDGAW